MTAHTLQHRVNKYYAHKLFAIYGQESRAINIIFIHKYLYLNSIISIVIINKEITRTIGFKQLTEEECPGSGLRIVFNVYTPYTERVRSF